MTKRLGRVAWFAAFVLWGCGGGSSGSTPSSTSEPTHTPAPGTDEAILVEGLYAATGFYALDANGPMVYVERSYVEGARIASEIAYGSPSHASSEGILGILTYWDARDAAGVWHLPYYRVLFGPDGSATVEDIPVPIRWDLELVPEDVTGKRAQDYLLDKYGKPATTSLAQPEATFAAGSMVYRPRFTATSDVVVRDRMWTLTLVRSEADLLATDYCASDLDDHYAFGFGLRAGGVLEVHELAGATTCHIGSTPRLPDGSWTKQSHTPDSWYVLTFPAEARAERTAWPFVPEQYASTVQMIIVDPGNGGSFYWGYLVPAGTVVPSLRTYTNAKGAEAIATALGLR